MNTIIWEVDCLSPPETSHYCKKCGLKTQHVSSGLFRVNAQQKALDIWLIYKCVHCKTTWKPEIFSRINPNSIPRALLVQFEENHPGLARQYAMDTSFLKSHGAEVKTPPYRVLGKALDFAQDTRVEITSPYPLPIRVSKILREKLGVSKRVFDAMVHSGALCMENGADIGKCKLHGGAVVIFTAL